MHCRERLWELAVKNAHAELETEAESKVETNAADEGKRNMATAEEDARHSAQINSITALNEIANGAEYGVLHNVRLGIIRYPLGKSGKGGSGLLHIVEQRMAKDGATLEEALDVAIKVGMAAEIGAETLHRYNTRHLDFDGTRAIIAQMADGSSVITGYEIDADEAAAANRRAAARNHSPHVSSEDVIRALCEKIASTLKSESHTAADVNSTAAEYLAAIEEDARDVLSSPYTDGADRKSGGIRFNVETYFGGGRELLAGWLEKEVKAKRLDKAYAMSLLDETDRIAALAKDLAVSGKYENFSKWSEATVEIGEDGKPVFGVVRPNGEYAMNIDFSTVCKKRRPMDRLFARLIRDGILGWENISDLSGEAVAAIQDILKRHGLEVACPICFVDAKRYRLGRVAERFANGGKASDDSSFPGWNNLVDAFEKGGDEWNKLVKEAKGKKSYLARCVRTINTRKDARHKVDPSLLVHSGGMDELIKNHPAIYNIWKSFGGTSHAKDSFQDTPYSNDIIAPRKTAINDNANRAFRADKAFLIGGVRIQSFTDFVARMWFDYVQMVAELAAAGLPVHCYTKESLLVKLFSETGIKINMSLVPAIAEGGIAPGLDANGDYVWADESFPAEEARMLRRRNGDVGTIAVGVSYEHILKLLADPEIDMVIPYHKSNINPVVAEIRRIAQFENFENEQNTRYARDMGGDRKQGKKLLHADNKFGFYEALMRTKDPKAAAKEYLSWCDENGYLPKFDRFRDNDNYYKLLVDFRVYDEYGNYAPQMPVRQQYREDLDKTVIEALEYGEEQERLYASLEEQIVREVGNEVFGKQSRHMVTAEEDAAREAANPASIADIIPSPDAGRTSIGVWGMPKSYSMDSLVKAMAVQDVINGTERPASAYRDLAKKLRIETVSPSRDYAKEAREVYAKEESRLKAIAMEGLTPQETAAEMAKAIEEKSIDKILSKLVSRSAKYGVDVGGTAMSAWQKMMNRLAAEARGLDLEQMQMDTGAISVSGYGAGKEPMAIRHFSLYFPRHPVF